MIIYILTRTSMRPNFFREQCNSIATQKLPENVSITHLISYDNDDSSGYVNSYLSENTHIKKQALRVERQERQKSSHFPYNIYCNQLQALITEPGWIMYLDDDDLFTNQESLSQIVDKITDADQLIIWKTKFPEFVKPGNNVFGKRIKPIGFPAICFCYHSKWINDAVWDDRKGSDSRVIYKLSKSIRKITWIDQILTLVNYKQGNGAGWGHQKDKE